GHPSWTGGRSSLETGQVARSAKLGRAAATLLARGQCQTCRGGGALLKGCRQQAPGMQVRWSTLLPPWRSLSSRRRSPSRLLPQRCPSASALSATTTSPAQASNIGAGADLEQGLRTAALPLRRCRHLVPRDRYSRRLGPTTA